MWICVWEKINCSATEVLVSGINDMNTKTCASCYFAYALAYPCNGDTCMCMACECVCMCVRVGGWGWCWESPSMALPPRALKWSRSSWSIPQLALLVILLWGSTRTSEAGVIVSREAQPAHRVLEIQASGPMPHSKHSTLWASSPACLTLYCILYVFIFLLV